MQSFFCAQKNTLTKGLLFLYYVRCVIVAGYAVRQYEVCAYFKRIAIHLRLV
jgi:hypothetical protein